MYNDACTCGVRIQFNSSIVNQKQKQSKTKRTSVVATRHFQFLKTIKIKNE